MTTPTDVTDMHRHKLGESLSKVTKTAEKTKIAGILATPRVSRNNTLYLPDQLAKNHGRTVIIDLEHNHERSIGFARLIWNAELQRLEYSGEISDPTVEAELHSGQEYQTSLEGSCESQEICGEGMCYNACTAETMIDRMALVLQPGIPETTVSIVEKLLVPASSSNSHTLTIGETFHKMTDPKKEQDDDGKKECPEGKEWDKEAGKCIDKKMEVTPELEEKLVSFGWMRPKKETTSPSVIDPDSTLGKKANETVKDCGCKAEEKREKYPLLVGKEELEVIINPIVDNLKVLNREIGERGREKLKESAQPTATVGVPKRMMALQESYNRFTEFWNNREIPSMYWSVNKTQWLKDHDYDARTGRFTINKTIAETITATDVPAITFARRILLDPSDITRYATRAHVNYMEAGQGTDLINWYTGDAGSAGFEAQTVGTTFTDRTVTVTRQQAQLSKRVMGVKVGYYDVHDIPGGILEFVNEVLGLRAIEDENSFVVGTGSGGFSEAAFTPTNWIRGDTGAAITVENLAAVTFKREGIVHAKKLIAAQGYDTTPGAQACVMRPEQWAELMLDTNLNNFYQYARPDITQQGTLELLYGAELNTSTAIPFNDATNDMWRAVMLTKGITSGLGSDGKLEFEADRRNDVAQVFVSGRHRPVGKRILEMSGARISTTK